ncbi:MAG: hypothetical protein JWR61_2091 [Ferruginibacter sp.]|uniref:DUF4251 domain-containing protein n=1 Tax=Ferruginibacter sp. TaxID=1940288 RepID=UPI00265B0F20|nr:DUF4251 domain-containing protein [Ferruginibacter sp.]MDB5277136.1 hypothetical protein [Ferruginibacter sp.]
MKKTVKLLPFFLFLMLFMCIQIVVTAQQKVAAKETTIKNLLDNQRYVFYAESVIPSSGRQRILTTDYTVTILKDSIISDLPYFGRAYAAPIGNTDGGIKFTSVDFDYSINRRKKGGWDVNIKPKDGQDVQNMSLTIYDNGKAYLNVNSNNRQAISFNGRITNIK